MADAKAILFGGKDFADEKVFVQGVKINIGSWNYCAEFFGTNSIAAAVLFVI